MARVPEHMRERARALRRNRTETEKLLWEHLAANKMGVHFRFQHPVNDYILDFACAKLKVCVEIDGATHDEDWDTLRDLELRHRGWQVLRFTNGDVYGDLERVLHEIRLAIETRQRHKEG